MADSTLYKSGLSKAMAICSKSEHCISDIREKLYAWGLNQSDSDRIIKELLKENFLNEERYAAAFVKDKFRYNRWGKMKISAHLKHKKLPTEIITSALGLIDYDEYRKVLTELISSHEKSVKAKTGYELKAKLFRYGISKGFESNLMYEVLNSEE